jgi:hypothetical protein
MLPVIRLDWMEIAVILVITFVGDIVVNYLCQHAGGDAAVAVPDQNKPGFRILVPEPACHLSHGLDMPLFLALLAADGWPETPRHINGRPRRLLFQESGRKK